VGDMVELHKATQKDVKRYFDKYKGQIMSLFSTIYTQMEMYNYFTIEIEGACQISEKNWEQVAAVLTTQSHLHLDHNEDISDLLTYLQKKETFLDAEDYLADEIINEVKEIDEKNRLKKGLAKKKTSNKSNDKPSSRPSSRSSKKSSK
jgi:thioredoxin-related protein